MLAQQLGRERLLENGRVQQRIAAESQALAPALKELLAGKSEKSEGPSEDQLRAAGFFKKPDGSWGRLQPEGAGAK